MNDTGPPRSHPLSPTGARRLRSAGLISLCVIACLSALTAAPALALPAQFGEEGSGAGQFKEPLGVAVEQESGDVYIADRNNQRIDKFDAAGNFLLAWGWGVADGKTQALQTCTSTCFAGIGGAGSGQFEEHSPEGIAVDNDPFSFPSHGDVYVIDAIDNRVEKFDSAGDFLLMFGGEVNKAGGDVCLAGEECQAGKPGTLAGEFERLSGRSIAVDSTGHVFVGDENRIQEFSPAGAVEAQIPLLGAGSIKNLVVDSAGDLYVQAGGLLGIHKYDTSGTELGKARDASGEPSAITPGPTDELFVNDGQNQGAHHILEYDPAGNQLASFGSEGVGGSRGIAYSNSLELLYVLNAGAVRLLSPPPRGPLVIGESAKAIEPTSATLNATVNPEGPEATTYHFEYDTTPYAEGEAPHGQSTAETPLEGGEFEDQPASAAIEELQPSTTYHFRVVATNGSETTEGPDQSFTTLPPVSIDGEFATQVSAKSARLGAELNPHGQATEYHFEWGLSASYGEEAPIPDASAGSGPGDVSVPPLQIQGLSPNTTYHYRVVAHNAFGTVEGEDRTFTTQGEEPSVLPDGRQWEMVSPANKEGVSLEAMAKEGAVIQAAEDGSAITYVAKAAIEEESPSNRSLSNTQVLSRRGPGGWQSKDISTPYETVATFLPGLLSEYRLFANDLSSGIVEPQGPTPLSPQTSEATPYLRSNGEAGQFCLTVASCYRPLVSGCPPPGEPCPASVQEAANVPVGTKFADEVEFVSASPDARRVVLGSPQNLTPGFEGTGSGSLYEWSEGSLRPVSVLPGGEAALGASVGATLGGNPDSNMRGAVSTEGDRVNFTAGANLYLRDMTLGRTVQLDAVQGGTGGGGGSGVNFQGANRDASKVFFTDDARLTGNATARPSEPDLYECEVSAVGGKLSCALKDLTVDANVGQAADVQGVVPAFGEDGRLVYFAANGVLAPGAKPGDCAQESESASCNLYVRDTASGQTRLVAEPSGQDAPDWLGHGSLANLTARSSPDGRYLAFMSERSLTGYDNRDAHSGARDEEAFLYDATSATTRCVSCDPSGARPEGIFDVNKFPGLLVDRPATWASRWLAGSVPGWTPYDLLHALYQSRYLSNSGRMFFNSADALVPQDANGKEDVYQYEPQSVGDCTKAGGCVSLISSGTSSEESTFMDAGADGSSAFFMTAEKLSTADVDSDFDIYDAHVCTASSPCPPQATSVPPPCATTDSCRVAPSPQPQIFGPPPSATFSGAGNLAPPASAGKPSVKKPTRAQLLARALKACAKKPKRKRASCRVQARRRYGPVKRKGAAKKTSRHASSGAKGRGR